MAYKKGYNRQKYNIGNIKNIYELAGHSQVRFKALPLIEIRLDFQTLVIVREQMRF